MNLDKKIQALRKGFTLIEILIVLALLVFVFAIASSKLFSNKKKVSSVFTSLNRLNRKVATLSKVHGKTYRIVIEVNPNKPDRVWVEKHSNELGYKIDPSFYKEPSVIYPLLSITSVEKEEGITSEGLVYIYYYSKNLGPEVAIHLNRSDTRAPFTLYLDSIQREFHVINKNVPLKDCASYLL